MDLQTRLDVVNAENDDLRERIAYLERMMFATNIVFPLEWELTGSEALVLGAMVARDLASKEYLLSALDRPGHDQPEIKIVDVFICKMRKKLKRFGIEIETRWGQGYRLPDAVRARFQLEYARRQAA